MDRAKILCREPARIEQCNRQRIAERQAHRGRDRRRRCCFAGFAAIGHDERRGRRFRQGRVRFEGHADHRDVQTVAVIEQIGKLSRLARARNAEHAILLGDHAEIAVAGFSGMDKISGRAGRGQGRRNLARDVAGLAHAGDDDAALGGGEQLRRQHERLSERPAQSHSQLFERPRLCTDRLLPRSNRRVRLDQV